MDLPDLPIFEIYPPVPQKPDILRKKIEDLTPEQINYKDERYPFNCDFYIGDLDIFIELNLHWTHGKEPFDVKNKENLKIVEQWKEKTLNFMTRQ